MPWLSVNQTRLAAPRAVPRPFLALDVQRAGIPGQPGAKSTLRSGGCFMIATISADRSGHSCGAGLQAGVTDLLSQFVRTLGRTHLTFAPRRGVMTPPTESFMVDSAAAQITRLLHDWRSGDREALDRLIPL